MGVSEDGRVRLGAPTLLTTVAMVLLLVLAAPLSASASQQEYFYGKATKGTWKYSPGYKYWTVSSGYGNEQPLVITIQARAGSMVAQGLGGAAVHIPPSQVVNRYIGCRWSQDTWGQSSYMISCTGYY